MSDALCIGCALTKVAVVFPAPLADRWNEHDPFEIWKTVEECMIQALSVSRWNVLTE